MQRRPKYTPLDRECDHCLTKRATWALMFFVLAFSTLSFRVFSLQMLEHDRWTQHVVANRQRSEPLPAARGAIFDTNHRLLATDEMVQAVVFDNIFLNEKKSKGAMDRMAVALAKSEGRPWTDIRRSWSEAELQQRYLWWMATMIAPAIGKTPDEVCNAIKDRTNKYGEKLAWDEGETVLTKEINAIQSGALKKVMADNPFSCLRISSQFRRSYPGERDLTPIVGLINSNGPVCGVEFGRQNDLKGTPGRRDFEIDGSGKEVTAFHGQLIEPIQGKSLRLTLDTTLQDIVEETLDEEGNEPGEVYVKPLKCDRVMVVLLDAKTMAIRAVACRNGEDKKDENSPPKLNIVNAATEQVYEPGSTMKIVTLATALDSGKVGPNTMIQINGPRYDDVDVKPINDDEPWGSLSVTDILVHSSNIGAYKLARTVGMKKFEEMVRDFGFGTKTGILGMDAKTGLPLGRETSGILHRNWDYNVLARTSYGYNIAVTPVQMCGALGVILNDGWYKRPYLVEATMDEKNRVLEQHESKPERRVISSSAARHTAEAMLQVVERGTGTKAQSQDYYYAGKTGTARKASGNGYEEGEYVVSFLGYAPVSNPKLIGVVVLDRPHGGSESLYGGKLAAPVFRRIMDRAMRYYNVPAENVQHAKPKRS